MGDINQCRRLQRHFYFAHGFLAFQTFVATGSTCQWMARSGSARPFPFRRRATVAEYVAVEASLRLRQRNVFLLDGCGNQQPERLLQLLETLPA